jgi:hypothetical protein
MSIVCCCVFDWPTVCLLNRLGYVLECLISTTLIHSRLLYVLEYLLYITGGVEWPLPLPTEALRRTNNFRMVTATPTMETKD